MIVGSTSIATSEVFWSAKRHGPETFGPSPALTEAVAIGVRSTASGSLAVVAPVLVVPAACAATSSGDCQVPVAAFQ